jgi:hypothetical protein
VVLDQFEQWLFARQGEKETELVATLRQCDGEHVQALCLVRDDFWMTATRFMRDLEIDMVPDRNVAAVDLFDPKHARKVLAAYGRAYQALPAGSGELTKEQKTFLDQAVAGLAQDGRRPGAAAVRRNGRGQALDARTPRGRRHDGVGVKFLEIFASARQPESPLPPEGRRLFLARCPRRAPTSRAG